MITLTLKSNYPITEDASKLRGFFATKFNEYSLLHQHKDVDKLLYRYPRVQYKILDNIPVVLGIEEGADLLKEIYDRYDEIRLGDNVYKIIERGITLKEVEFGLSRDILSYRFITPWIALNKDNYERFYKLSRRDGRELLRKTLVGNILSASKGLDYVVLDEIKLDIGRIDQKKCFIKKTPLIGFECDFMVNFLIPDYLGLGKSVSRGFGVIKRLKDLKEESVRS
ncbi:MAG: CRISPR-associated endonuclease Cas6 [Halobacteriota archaeon]|nr:CRISPR-associated endonuclease Cas6 [Halobacteriota archaeon]